jgi:hypothetical protein
LPRHGAVRSRQATVRATKRRLFWFEPVSHPVDAFTLPSEPTSHGLVVLELGERTQASATWTAYAHRKRCAIALYDQSLRGPTTGRVRDAESRRAKRNETQVGSCEFRIKLLLTQPWAQYAFGLLCGGDIHDQSDRPIHRYDDSRRNPRWSFSADLTSNFSCYRERRMWRW